MDYYDYEDYYEPSEFDEKVEEFDRSFPPKEKGWMPSQEKFYIYSHSSVGE